MPDNQSCELSRLHGSELIAAERPFTAAFDPGIDYGHYVLFFVLGGGAIVVPLYLGYVSPFAGMCAAVLAVVATYVAVLVQQRRWASRRAESVRAFADQHRFEYLDAAPPDFLSAVRETQCFKEFDRCAAVNFVSGQLDGRAFLLFDSLASMRDPDDPLELCATFVVLEAPPEIPNFILRRPALAARLRRNVSNVMKSGDNQHAREPFNELYQLRIADDVTRHVPLNPVLKSFLVCQPNWLIEKQHGLLFLARNNRGPGISESGYSAPIRSFELSGVTSGKDTTAYIAVRDLEQFCRQTMRLRDELADSQSIS